MKSAVRQKRRRVHSRFSGSATRSAGSAGLPPGRPTSRDTTRSKRKTSVTVEARRLQTTLDGIRAAIFSTDVDGRIALMNKAAEELTGWTLRDAASKPLKDVCQVFDERTGEPSDLAGIVLGSRQPTILGKLVMLISDRKERKLVSGLAGPIVDKAAETIGGVLVLMETSERQEMEETDIVAEKLESVGLLAGGIAHDFNNLLMSIAGNIYLAKVHINSRDKALESLRDAELACKNAKSLSQKLLTFSKGGAPILKKAFLPHILRRATRSALRGSDIHPRFSIARELWPMELDEGQIEQAMVNLIINAKEAMPEGGLIEIRAKNETIGENVKLPLTAGKYVSITVSDQGKGISREHLSKIFDPYFTTRQPGRGLGLSIVYSIIRKHHGMISVESQPDLGTTFHIYLPAFRQGFSNGRKNGKPSSPSEENP